jgi:DNA-binding NarL/FixJ family response regulator
MQDEDREEVLNLGAKGYYVKHQMTIDELSAIITHELNL